MKVEQPPAKARNGESRQDGANQPKKTGRTVTQGKSPSDGVFHSVPIPPPLEELKSAVFPQMVDAPQHWRSPAVKML